MGQRVVLLRQTMRVASMWRLVCPEIIWAKRACFLLTSCEHSKYKVNHNCWGGQPREKTILESPLSSTRENLGGGDSETGKLPHLKANVKQKPSPQRQSKKPFLHSSASSFLSLQSQKANRARRKNKKPGIGMLVGNLRKFEKEGQKTVLLKHG